MGGGGRSGILAWTGSASSRPSSSMARVGGEHLGGGVGILFCLIGHATTAAAAGAFPGSSAVRTREWRRRPPRLLTLLSLARFASPGNDAGGLAWVRRWSGGRVGERNAGGRGHSLAWLGCESRGPRRRDCLGFGTRPPRCTTSACAARLKSFNLPNLWGLDHCSCGEGPLVERSRPGKCVHRTCTLFEPNYPRWPRSTGVRVPCLVDQATEVGCSCCASLHTQVPTHPRRLPV